VDDDAVTDVVGGDGEDCLAAAEGEAGHGSALLPEQALAEAYARANGEGTDGVDRDDEVPQGPFAALHVGLLPPAPGWGLMGGSEIKLPAGISYVNTRG